MKNILITGGCGFTGTILATNLLKVGYRVTVLDVMWFGNFLEPHPELCVLAGDIREIQNISLKQFDSIVHLANVANDPSVELNPSLSWEVNVLAGQQLMESAVRAGVNQFIYASSGSVYGIKEEPDVTEDLIPVPISVYNKTKMVAERVFLSYQDRIHVQCVRPATVCGWSPRMRLDVSVNLLTMKALMNGNMTVFGGEQTRPNIHIQDLARVYLHFLENPDLCSGFYNAGFENISIRQLAEKISKQVPSVIEYTESNDPRSYRQNSDKLLDTGFWPKFNVDDAITDLIEKFESGELQDSDRSYTVRWMKHLGLGE